MAVPKKTYGGIGVALCVIGWLLPWASSGRGEEFRLAYAGVRGGTSANEGSQEIWQSQAFVDWNLPWHWDLGKEWHLQSRLDLSAGWVGNSTDEAAIGAAGPLLVLSRPRLPLTLEAGSSPTLLSRHNFGDKNLGMDFQFTTTIGLYWDFAEHWRVGYRFEHISNAGLTLPNDGLAMHLLSLSYRF